MKVLTITFLICVQIFQLHAQSIPAIKLAVQKSPNPVAYVRDTLKKKFSLDTVIITNSTHFQSLTDSLAYKGQVRKVYGPYGKRVLVQILSKANNSFTRFSQIFFDTATFSLRIADSIANSIIKRVKEGSASFEDLAQTYSMGGEGAAKGDLGWVARGAMQPDIEKQLASRKKGEIVKFTSKAGVHLMKRTTDPREDTGFVLIMRIFL